MPKRKKNSQFEKNNLSRILFTFLFFIVISLSGFYFFNKFQKPKDLQTVKVSLVWLHQAQFAGIYTAIEKGFYKDVGLDVEVEEFEFGKPLEEELVEGKTDFSIIHAVRLLEAVGRGLDVTAVASIYQTSPHAFVTGEAGLITRPKDMMGKTLGIKGDNVSAKILYSVLLAELGISKSDVLFKAIDFSTHEFEDIQNGAVDIIDLYRTDQVYSFEQNDVPYQLIPPEDFRFDMYGDVIATSGQMIRDNPKLVQKFVDATIKGWEYAAENQDKSVEFTSKYIVSEDYQDEAYNQFILEKSLPLIEPIDDEKIGYMETTKWSHLYNVMLVNNIIENEFDIGDAFTLEFID